MPSAGVTMAAVLLLGASGAIVGFLFTDEQRRLEGEDEPPEWTYFQGEPGETPFAPPDWGESFPDCYGTMQSPINLSGAHEVQKVASLVAYDLTFHPTECTSSELHFSPGEHSWSVNFADCMDRSSLEFDGNHFQLLNVHIHSRSEHENGGSLHDAEIHMVHVMEGTTDELLVVGVMLDASSYGLNSMLTDLWSVFGAGLEEAPLTDDWSISPYGLLPAGPNYSHYMGSLTTPPCTEGVRWIVMSDVTLIGKSQLDLFRAAMGQHRMTDVDGGTNRPVQLLNGREPAGAEMKGRAECEDGRDAEKPVIVDQKYPRRFKLFSGALLLAKIAVGLGGVLVVTIPALHRAEPPAKSRHVEHMGRRKMARTPGRGQLRGIPSRLTDERKEVHPGAAAASDTDNHPEDRTGADAAQAAPASRRLRTLPMEGHWGEWIVSGMAGSDENEEHGEKPEEKEGAGGKNVGFKDWLITEFVSDEHHDANSDPLEDNERAFPGRGEGGERNGNIDERRQHRRDEEERLNKLKTRFPNDDDGMFFFGDLARSDYPSRHGGRVVPRQRRGQGGNEGGIDVKSERAGLRRKDGYLGTIEGSSDAKEGSVDAEKHVSQSARDGDTEVDPREHLAQETMEEAEEVDWSTDDDGVMHNVFVSRPAAFGPPPSHDQLDNRDRLWAWDRAADDSDYYGWEKLQQGFQTTNLNPESTPEWEEFPHTNESGVLLSRRRYRRPGESQEGGDEISSLAWPQSEDDTYVPGAWTTDDNFLIHVAHYSRAAGGNQHSMPPEAAEPAGPRRHWERGQERLWDTGGDVLSNQGAYHQLGAARGRVDDPEAVDMPAVDMPAVPVGKEARTWESWGTEQSDGLSPLFPSTPKERGQKPTALPGVGADEQLVGWLLNGEFEHYNSYASTTSGERDGEQGSAIADDWELEGSPCFLEEDQMRTATGDGCGGHATPAEEAGSGDDLAFGSMADYYERFAYDHDEIPTAVAAVPQVGVEEEREDEKEKGPFEPYSEYTSYLAEMEQLLQQEFPGRFSADMLQQQLQPLERHGVKTSSSVAYAQQRKHPPDKQEKQWGHLGDAMKPLVDAFVDAFSARESGGDGAMGFLQGLLPRKLSGSRDEPTTFLVAVKGT
eukprot:g6990.t1